MKWALRLVLVLVVVLGGLFLAFRTPDTDPAEMRAKYGAPPSQFVEIASGVTVHLRDEGPRGDGALGLPIVLLHGSNSDLHTWDEWAERLSQTRRVIRFDQVGHGLTGPDPEENYSRANYAQDIGEVADALGLERFILGGNSMGGKHALAFAAAYPERVAGLILVDASGGPELALGTDAQAEAEEDSGNIGFAIAQMPGINRLAEQVTPRSLIEQSLVETVADSALVDDAIVDRYWELLRYPGNRRATLLRFSAAYDPLTEAEIASITAPALILWGEEDRLIPVAAGRWLKQTLPNSELVVYPEIGHLPQKEAPEASLASVQEWLLNLE